MVANSQDRALSHKALAAGESVLVYAKSSADMFTHSDSAAAAFAAGGSKRGSGLVFLATAAAAKKAFAVAKPIVTGRDQIVVSQAEKFVGAVASCGSFAISIAVGMGTGGLGLFIAGTQAVACGKDLIDLTTIDGQGRGWFEQSSGRKWFGLTLDTVGAIGSLLALGRKHAASALFGSVGRGLVKATKAERIALVAEAGGIALKGAGVIIEAAPDGTDREIPAERHRVESILDESGLPWRNSLLEPDCLYLKVSLKCLLGDLSHVRPRY